MDTKQILIVFLDMSMEISSNIDRIKPHESVPDSTMRNFNGTNVYIQNFYRPQMFELYTHSIY